MGNRTVVIQAAKALTQTVPAVGTGKPGIDDAEAVRGQIEQE
jgi:hypothetical protein